jgi:hypothetical protein
MESSKSQTTPFNELSVLDAYDCMRDILKDLVALGNRQVKGGYNYNPDLAAVIDRAKKVLQ